MKEQNLLQDELQKLKLIAPSPINLSFGLGYLTFAFPLPFIRELKPIATQLIMMVQDGLVSSLNVLQVLAVLKLRVLSRNPKDLVKELHSNVQHFINQLALDNSYLENKYFKKDEQKQNIVSQYLGIQCPICSTEINSLELCYLSCGHMCHRECLNAHCQQKISNKLIPIPCPLQDCKTQLLQQEITQYLSAELRQRYDQFSFQNYVQNHMDDTSWCPTPGCSAVFAFDQALTNYKCPACRKHYCLVCKCEFHNGFTCEEYKKFANLSEDDKQFMFLVKGAKYKQCPNCKFWVEKNEGCDHMTCRCKYQFCYICGGKYNRCKCKGFVNEVEEPKMLQPFGLEQPVNKIANSPPRVSFNKLNEPKLKIRPLSALFRRQQAPVQHYQDEYERSLQQARAMQMREQEQLRRREEEQMLIAIKESSQQLVRQSRIREMFQKQELASQQNYVREREMKQKREVEKANKFGQESTKINQLYSKLNKYREAEKQEVKLQDKPEKLQIRMPPQQVVQQGYQERKQKIHKKLESSGIFPKVKAFFCKPQKERLQKEDISRKDQSESQLKSIELGPVLGQMKKEQTNSKEKELI